MTLPEPTVAELRELADALHLDPSDEALATFADRIADELDAYDLVREYAATSDHEPPERAASRAPDDPYNAWITECDIRGADGGPLAGWDVAIKDNVGVAGVEMTCGSRVMEGYVPATDATIVTRLLDAGARLVGKTNMDDMAFTGVGHSSAYGPTLNPHDPDRLSGGSSGGSAIAVAEDEADLAIGADQGGSIRVPAAWCGVVGHKPTHGLVPYTGIAGIENTIDHVGPLAADIETVAQALTVLAGRDPDDPRQPAHVPTAEYEAALGSDPESFSVAVLEEGFTRPDAADAVNERVRAGLDDLADRGAAVESVSLPIHDDAADIYTVALAEGTVAAFRGEGVGHNWTGWYNTDWVAAFGERRREQGGAFPPTYVYNLLLGAYTAEAGHSTYYAEAMNLRERLTEAYSDLLTTYDAIAMPTAPQLPIEYVPDQPLDAFLDDAWSSLPNACPFNATGHPALSVPVEPADGLPVGLMLVGQHFDDATLLDIGAAVESGRTA